MTAIISPRMQKRARAVTCGSSSMMEMALRNVLCMSISRNVLTSLQRRSRGSSTMRQRGQRNGRPKSGSTMSLQASELVPPLKHRNLCSPDGYANYILFLQGRRGADNGSGEYCRGLGDLGQTCFGRGLGFGSAW